MTGTGRDADMTDPAHVFQHYLRSAREALWWKLDGLSEREVRLPRTLTGTNLLGIVKHCLNVEAGYFGVTFGRPWPTPEELVGETAYEQDPQADWYATEDESRDGLLDLHRRVGEFADETIATLGPEATGRVPWWPPDRGDVPLHRVAVHVLGDLTRHAGHADILREHIDGSIGMVPGNTNLPDELDGADWSAYVARLTAIADRFA